MILSVRIAFLFNYLVVPENIQTAHLLKVFQFERRSPKNYLVSNLFLKTHLELISNGDFVVFLLFQCVRDTTDCFKVIQRKLSAECPALRNLAIDWTQEIKQYNVAISWNYSVTSPGNQCSFPSKIYSMNISTKNSLVMGQDLIYSHDLTWCYFICWSFIAQDLFFHPILPKLLPHLSLNFQKETLR